MSKKTSVYFGPPLLDLTGNLTAEDSVSGRINRCAERYRAILNRHGIDLDAEESVILGNCLSGGWVEPLLIRHLDTEIEESEYADSAAAKRLISKLRSASFADRVATVERLGF